jgi:predicted enzyme related to lactoylglutathione lyase
MTAEPLQSAEHDRRVDYVELAVTDVAAAKRFYGQVFAWQFQDYGPDYASFADGRLSGGFRMAEQVQTGGPLIVIFALDLAAAERRVLAAGGRVVRPTFSFPGGRRFHFTDPSGNELAVWSDRP